MRRIFKRVYNIDLKKQYEINKHEILWISMAHGDFVTKRCCCCRYDCAWRAYRLSSTLESGSLALVRRVCLVRAEATCRSIHDERRKGREGVAFEVVSANMCAQYRTVYTLYAKRINALSVKDVLD